MVLNKSLQVQRLMRLIVARTTLTITQEINVQNMNVELVAQMFKNYQSNVLFHLEGTQTTSPRLICCIFINLTPLQLRTA
jgi:hypothetical protein